MKNNKVLKTLLIIVCIIAFIIGVYFGYQTYAKNNIEDSNSKETVVEKEKVTPLLYEVTKEGSNNKMYLFGSIHVTGDKQLEFPDYLLDAYKNSKYLACEFDIVAYTEDSDRLLDDAMNMMYKDQTTIADHMSEEGYTKLVNFLKEKKSYSKMYDMYQLYFFQSLVSNVMINDAKLNAEEGIDSIFLKKAKEDNKTILEVESYDLQSELLSSFSDELYELAIIDTIDNYDEGVETLKKMYEAWKQGNEEELVKYASEDMDVKETYTKKQKELIKDYNKKLIDDRNNTMTEKAIEYFNKDQDVLYMVGAFHIIGENGMAKQLEKKGFTVKQIQ